MQRMVGLTGRLADRAGLLHRTEDALEQADLPLRPPEALFFYFAGLFVVGLLGLLDPADPDGADPRRCRRRRCPSSCCTAGARGGSASSRCSSPTR